MAIKYICDGCEFSTDDRDDIFERGFYEKALYCHNCDYKAEQLENEIDGVRREAVTLFEEKVKRLREVARKELSKLPDDVETA